MCRRHVGHDPDVSAVCGEPRFTDGSRDDLLNPSLIVEVLSDGAEAHDRGEKFEHYATIASLRESITSLREGDGWKLRSYGAGDHLQLVVDELYDKVFPS